MSNLKKIVALVLAMALVMTMFAGAAIKTDLSKFTDGENFTEAQQDALALVNAVGVIEGVSENEIGAASLTRAQLVKVLYVLSNGTKDGASKYVASVFDDVADDNWAAGYIAWASLKGVVKGVSATEFNPDAKVTPVQAAAMLARLFDADACMNPETFNQDAQAAAIKYGLTDGIETAGFFSAKEISRGDMFIMLANALTYEYKAGHNLLTDVFGIEKIEGAILLGAEKQYYKVDAGGQNANNAYSVFAFRTATSGDVTYFATDLLCVEDDADLDAIGCKYVIYVSEDASYNGFRKLYAAYEMDDNYYSVVEGTVDDGKLVFTGDNQNVYFDDAVVVYVDGEIDENGVAAFKAAYGVANKATYKLIDNDGDGKYEYAFIEHWTLDDLENGEWITGNVTAYSAKGLYSINGTQYQWGQYWDGTAFVDCSAECSAFLGTEFNAISDVKYDFYVADGYLYAVKVSESTQFYGNYAIVIEDDCCCYKNMSYYTFLNEQNEYVQAYVRNANGYNANTNLTQGQWVDSHAAGSLEEDTLVEIVNVDGDIIDIYTADYNFKNSTYYYNGDRYALAEKVVSEPYYFGYTYVDQVDISAPNDDYILISSVNSIEGIAGIATTEEGKYAYDLKELMDAIMANGNYDVDTAVEAYDWIISNDGLEGFKFAVKSAASVTFKAYADLEQADFQIYRANGIWSYRNWYGVENVTFTVTIAGTEYYLEENEEDGKWYAIYTEDGNDPGIEVGDSITEVFGEVIVKALAAAQNSNEVNYAYIADEDADFAEIEEVISELYDDIYNDGVNLIDGGQGYLNTTYGVVFLLGRLSSGSDNISWRAYKAADVNKDFATGMFLDDNYGWANRDEYYGEQMDGNGWTCCDQLISTSLNGTNYVKAMAVTTVEQKDLEDYFDYLTSSVGQYFVFKGNYFKDVEVIEDNLLELLEAGTFDINALVETFAGYDYDVLPSGWIENEDAELLFYVGFTKEFATGGYELMFIDTDLNIVTKWCGMEVNALIAKYLNPMDLVLVYTDEDGVITDMINLTVNYDLEDYYSDALFNFLSGLAFIDGNVSLAYETIKTATGVSAGVLSGEGVIANTNNVYGLENLVTYTYNTENVLYITDLTNMEYTTEYSEDYAGETVAALTINGRTIVLVGLSVSID